MNNEAKFASITSALLARKGDAAPSVIPPVRSVPAYDTEREYEPRPMLPVRPAPRPTQKRPRLLASAERKRRVVVTLTADEFQKLGIVAAKKDSTRHDLVRDALFDQLNAFARQEAPACACINSGQPCDCDSTSDSVPTPAMP
jgi:hypothetical protein